MTKQDWKKKGLIIKPPKTSWGQSHCMLPTPIKLTEKKLEFFMELEIKKTNLPLVMRI